MSKVEKLQFDIAKYNKLADIGMEIYSYNKVGEFLHNAIFYGHKTQRLLQDLDILTEDYGIIL